jgi:hypothetical protein
VQQQTSINSNSSRVTLQTARQSFHVRQVMRTALAEILAEASEDNPRIHIGLLKAQLSLDRCVNFFKRAMLADFPITRRGGSVAEDRGSSPPETPGIPEGPEVWVSVERPPLQGRIDMVAGGRIMDFKTGEPDPSDKDQMYFYALLWWLKTGRLPTSLEIIYMHMTEGVRIDVPSIPMLADLLQRLCCDIPAMHEGLASGTVEARPDEQRCRLCPVRQHCDAFWSAPTTQGLRADHLKRLGEHAQVASHITDVRLNKLPVGWDLGNACAGLAHSPELGPLCITIDQHRCPEAGERKPHSARILGARVQRHSTAWAVRIARQTEVFWQGMTRYITWYATHASMQSVSAPAH